MNTRRFKNGFIALTVFAAAVLAACLSSIVQAQADDSAGYADRWKIQKGFEIAPVPLNLRGKDRDLVGLGSYIVNGMSDCNSCHSAGPATAYADDHNPFFGEPAQINPQTYLGGGRDFGTMGLPPPSPHIISRNLTPDRTGRPAGGRTFRDFLQILRTGIDLDHLHPNCSATITTNCFPPTTDVDGALLQIMPWPVFRNMSDHDLLAIYTYLSAIPCLSAGNPGDDLYNDCGP